jgi:CDP-diacylglycerol pyrophosphatase
VRLKTLLGCAAGIALALAATAFAEPAGAPAARDRLRYIVQQECLPHWLNEHDPAPCLSVSATGEASVGFAVLADRKGGAHFLLIPTQTIRGIESPEARAPGALNYFDAAWASRDVLARAIGRAVPRTAVGLAVNQVHARSQDQLHIHIGCMRAEVAEALRLQAEAIGPDWQSIELAGWPYAAMRIMGERPGLANPVRLLAGYLQSVDKSMEDFTLLLSGMRFREGPGFVLLAGNAVPGAELLLDSTCAMAPRGTN